MKTVLNSIASINAIPSATIACWTGKTTATTWAIAMTNKKKCAGSGQKPILTTREDGADMNPGNIMHSCPVCDRSWDRSWARNTLNDGWPNLPIPKHFVEKEGT
jgi:hypothetical protein